jgi:hypothetical protein
LGCPHPAPARQSRSIRAARRGLVVERRLEHGLETAGVAHDDDLLHGRHLPGQTLEQWQQIFVDEDDPIFGMVDNVLEIGWRQPQVESMEHRSHARNRIVKFEVAVGVPAKTADAITGLDAQ